LKRLTQTVARALGALAIVPVVATAQVPAGYPASYADTIAAAKKEGKVVI
jgi:iron(III) transport system substrate-binding protein